ncbi:MAG: pyrroloquinoline-quinone synthase [Solirubrobacteraceae bacterium]|nr:pyrroloquinoline-quinone synthase [Solirubrobacteraceae bacterium]
MTVTRQIDALVERWNFLRHPFNEAWSEGELTHADLARYAGAYRWPVLALAAVTELARDNEHARKGYEHVALWEAFAAACGAPPAEPIGAAAECALAWLAARDRLERLAVLYAIESAQPAIAATKLDGLIRHYGFVEGPATEYFAVHAQRDAEPAAAARDALLAQATSSDCTRLTEQAEAALRAKWRLLDEVMAQQWTTTA